MKKIVAINASPRAMWNTGTLVREAAKGAESEGAEVKVFDLYKLEKFTGCISCFGCKLPEHLGTCICKDGLNVLDDVGGMWGYRDFLVTIHEGSEEEQDEMREWARYLGWTGRNVSPKNML